MPPLTPLNAGDAPPWTGSRALVTGGAGFLGSAIVWELNRRGCEEIFIADFASRADRRPILAPLRFLDYLDPYAALEKLRSGALGKIDFVFHLGACSSTTETDAAYLRRNNFEYSRDLTAAALEAGSRLVYASSAATYGDGSAGMDDADPSTLDRLRPLNLYAQSKQEMDLEARRRGWLERVVALKYFNVFGPNEGHKGEMRSVALKSFVQATSSGAIRLFKSYRREFGDGQQQRDFLYVKDAAAMTLHLAANPQANGIFNVGSGEAHSWEELACAVFAALGRPPRIEYIEMPEAIRDKYQYFTRADIGKLRAAGYAAPITPLAEGVRDYVTRYLVPCKSLGEEAEEAVKS